jgi:hypothetical protein
MSSMSLANHQFNPLVEMICNHTGGITGTFDVIMDYKAARRPPVTPMARAKSHWTHEALQVQLYAWLRAQQPMTTPVKAAILIYVNELSPSQSELVDLQKEMVQGRTDVVPAAGRVGRVESGIFCQ